MVRQLEDPSMIRRPLFATMAAVLLLLTLVTGNVLARPVYVFPTLMRGSSEVPGPGDANAIGHATIMIEPDNDRLCWIVSWNRIDGTVFASHIHGPADTTQAAPVLIPLFMNEAFGSTGINRGCMQSADIGPILDAIVANPQQYYVNVHSLPDFGPGAIRGQLG
jgi:CHRD domain